MERARAAGVVVLGCLTAAAVAMAVKLPAHADAAEVSGEGETALSQQEVLEEETPELTLEEIRQVTFTDVTGDGPAQDAMRYMAAREIMYGVGEGRFAPDSRLTRAQAVALQQRMSAASAADNGPEYTFSDVEPDAWYADALNWAAGQGIIGGYADGTFAPDRQVTRAELALLLWRQAALLGEEPQASGDLSAYRDGNSVGPASRLAVSWALEQGLYDALVTDTIHPGLPVSREQTAQILVAFLAAVEGDPLAVSLAAEDDLEPVVSASRANHEAIQAAVDSAAQKYGAVGVQVAVIEDGQVTDTFASGWATRGSDPMTANHKMRVASISKVLIGMETMRLREKGVVDLDTSIGGYWGVSAVNPRYPDVPVTLRTLLTHTSSLSSLGDDASRSYSAVRSRLANGTGFSAARPGDINSWNYNNYAFGVLGQTIELASGTCMNDLLRRDLFDIMGIDAAFAAGDLRDNSKLVTLVYHGGGVARSVSSQRPMHMPTTPGASGTYFAGGLTISAADLGKVTALLANDGRYEGLQLMKPETVAQMEAVNETQLADGSYQGLALRCRNDIYGRQRLYYHTGSAYGVYNCMSYDPATGDGVVVLTVGASGAKDSQGIYAICGEISAYVYKITQ